MSNRIRSHKCTTVRSLLYAWCTGPTEGACTILIPICKPQLCCAGVQASLVCIMPTKESRYMSANAYPLLPTLFTQTDPVTNLKVTPSVVISDFAIFGRIAVYVCQTPQHLDKEPAGRGLF